MRKLSLLFFGLFAVAMLAACGGGNDEAGASGERKVLRVGTTAQSYPSSYEEGGQLVGFDVEVLEAIAKNLDYEVEWTRSDFAGLMGQLEAGRLDTLANFVAVTEERAEKYNFSDPYAYAGSTIVTHEDNDFTSLEEFKGKTVSGVLGSNNVANLENYDPEIIPRTYETRDGALNDVINKRVDGYVQTKSVLIAEIEKGDLPLKFVGDPFLYEDISFIFPKSEDSELLRDVFNEELKKLREDGTLSDLSEKYFSGEDVTVKE